MFLDGSGYLEYVTLRFVHDQEIDVYGCKGA